MAYNVIHSAYTHIQSTASTEWNVVHNLNQLYPVVDCWIQLGNDVVKIVPESVQVIDAQTVQIVFSTAFAGKACVV